MESQLALERQIATPGSSTGGAFEMDLRTLLSQRTRLVLGVGLVIALIANVLYYLVLGTPATVASPWGDALSVVWLIGPAIFLAALLVCYLWQDLTASQLQKLNLAAFSLELFVVLQINALFNPADPLFIAVAVLLFLPAALIPWPLRYQVTLGVVAVGSFLLSKTLGVALIPGMQEYWAARGGSLALWNHIIEGTAGDTVLAVIALFASKSLYQLRKTEHKARRLGNYLILKQLGRGGMGSVYLAQHALMCRPTAVKVITPETDSSTALARFEREVRVSSTLTHPNTITIYDFGHTQGGEFYYAMEYLEGLDLQEMVERYGPIEPARAVYILLQLVGSLAEAHSRDIIHRDIKPSNIFLTRRGGLYDFVKVLDFGLAKEVDADAAAASITQSGTIFGTPMYIAPETVYGPADVDGRADIYNVGGVAYWMLTGRPPFTSSNTIGVLIDHVKTEPRPPSQVTELEIPRELDEIVLRCLAKKPEDRFFSAEELESELQALEFNPAWDRKRAREWWSLHGIVSEDALDCQCFAPEDFQSSEFELQELAAGTSA